MKKILSAIAILTASLTLMAHESEKDHRDDYQHLPKETYRNKAQDRRPQNFPWKLLIKDGQVNGCVHANQYYSDGSLLWLDGVEKTIKCSYSKFDERFQWKSTL